MSKPVITATRQFALCLALLLFPIVGLAQRTQSLQTIPGRVLHRSSAFSKRLYKSQRFLGWHYAAVAHQDTSHWTRGAQLAPAANTPEAVGNRQGPGGLNLPALSPSSSQPSSIAGFAAATTLPTGFIPTAVVQGDFNGDGKLDLAISNGGDNTIYVLLGNGDGTFAVPEILYTQGQSPVWLATAKLRTNGHLDLIAVDGDSNQVEVFTGNGDGTFQPGAIIARVPQTPTFILTGDFNNDGNMDLVVGLTVDTGIAASQFEILLGDGNGAFPGILVPPRVQNNTGGPLETNWIAAGDLNKDGWLDLVTTVEFGGSIVYLNQNGRAFLQGPVFGPQDSAVVTGLADMDGDGCLDAVEAGGYGQLTIAKGDCNGGFTQSAPIAELGDIDVAMVITDVDGDGHPDVVASSAFETEGTGGIGAYGGYLVSVLKGDGKGGVAPPAIYRIGAQAYGLAVADLSGNQRPDIITISQNENRASELFNDSKGGFGSPSGEAIGYVPTANQGVVTNAPNPLGVPQTVDVNGDGKPDVVVMEYGAVSTQPPQIAVLLNDGMGKLGPPIRSAIPVGPNIANPIFLVGNFRNTKTSDIIYTSTEGLNPIAFFPGNGDGTFGTPVVLTTQLWPDLLVSGDFNHDGKLDFAVLDGEPGTTPQLDVFLGNGDGTFNHLASQSLASLLGSESLASLRIFAPDQLIAGDFNHDGKIDLLIGYEIDTYLANSYNLDLALGNGDGSFQSPSLLMPNFGFVTVADVNNDGYLDLIQESAPSSTIAQSAIDGADGYTAAAITVYLGGPGGKFQQGGSYFAPGMLAGHPIVGDFNGDGITDVALPFSPTYGDPRGASRLQIFQGVGDGTFLPIGNSYQFPDQDAPMAGGDYRGLGVTDLLDLVGSTSSINTISASPSAALTITPDVAPLTGNSGSATLTLAVPASAAKVVQVTSSDPAVTLPSSVTFAAGQTQQSLSFTIGNGFDKTHVLALYAQLNGQTAVAYIPMANPNATSGVTAQAGNIGLPPPSVTPGEAASFMFTLESLGGYSGVFDQLTCSGLPAGLSCDFVLASMSLPAGGFASNSVSIMIPAGTTLGTHTVVVSASNGQVTPSATLSFGVGDFTLSVNPTLISAEGASGTFASVTGTFLNNLNETVNLTCTGLPAGASCNAANLSGGSPTDETTLSISTSASLTAADYPFQIVGSANVVSHSANATLRVSGFTASLDKTSAVISNGGSAAFTVTFISLNHFTSPAITLSCGSIAGLTCSSAPSQIGLSDNGTATTQLTVTYKAPVTASVKSKRLFSKSDQLLICLIVFIFPWRARRKCLSSLLWIAILGLFVVQVSGCGGGGTNGGNSQTLNVSVIANAPTNTAFLEVNVGAISLTVQQ